MLERLKFSQQEREGIELATWSSEDEFCDVVIN